MKEKLQDNPPIDLRINGIEIAEQHIYLHEQPIPLPHTYKLKIESRVNEAEKLIVCVLDIFLKDKEEKIDLAFFKINFIFQAPNFEVLPKKGNKIVLSREIADVLNQISVSSARGVIWAMMRGTHLHFSLLPLFKVDQFNLSFTEE